MNAIEEMMKGLGAEGWSGLRALDAGIGKAQDDAGARRLDTALLFERVFGSADGREVLEILRNTTLRRDMVPPQVAAREPVTMESIMPYVVFRAGQNAIVAEIERQLAIAVQRARTGGT